MAVEVAADPSSGSGATSALALVVFISDLPPGSVWQNSAVAGS